MSNRGPLEVLLASSAIMAELALGCRVYDLSDVGRPSDGGASLSDEEHFDASVVDARAERPDEPRDAERDREPVSEASPFVSDATTPPSDASDADPTVRVPFAV